MIGSDFLSNDFEKKYYNLKAPTKLALESSDALETKAFGSGPPWFEIERNTDKISI